MSDQQTHLSRRNVLKSGLSGAGVALVGGSIVSGTSAAKLVPGPTYSRGNLVSKVNRDGHYAWFPLGPSNWGRQKHPYDVRKDDSRWMATPAPGGAIKVRVENVGASGPPNRNAGFDVHLGPLGDLESVTVTSRTVQTQAGSEALLFVGLYLDVNDNGEFFTWENVDGTTERFGGVAGDEEGLTITNAGGGFRIDADTQFGLLVREGPKTLEQLQAGFEGIDGETRAALYVGVADKEAGGPEEAVIEEVRVERS